jgi:hypothetical protein
MLIGPVRFRFEPETRPNQTGPIKQLKKKAV